MVKIGAPKKPPEELKQVMTFRLRPGSKAALKKAAGDNGRTPTALGVKIIEDWLKKRKYLK